MIEYQHPTRIDRWREQIGDRPVSDERRPLGAMGYLTRAKQYRGLVEIERLTLVVLYDEHHRGGGKALRLAGFSGRRVPWGAEWGGYRSSRLFKDLLLQPIPRAQGRRVNVDQAALLNLGLRLDNAIDRCLKDGRRTVRRQPRLPRLWAGFRPLDAMRLFGDGPEFAEACRQQSQPADAVFQSARREIKGHVVYPLDWVSHCWNRIATVFAEIGRFPKLQVFTLQNLPGDLRGYQGAAGFNFYDSRFREWAVRRGRSDVTGTVDSHAHPQTNRLEPCNHRWIVCRTLSFSVQPHPKPEDFNG